MPPLRIAITGCGIAGTLAATLLSRSGHQVTLFERAPLLTPVGAGLLLQPSGQSVLSRANLLSQAIAHAEPITHLHALTHTARTLIRLDYPSDSPAYGVHRSDLFSTLHTAATQSGATILLNHEITHATQTNSHIALHTAHHELGPFDLAIAADGHNSALRRSSNIPCKVHEYPHGALWLTGPSSSVRNYLLQVTHGTRKLIGLLPTGNGRASLFHGLPTGDFAATRAAGFPKLRSEILSLCPQAEELLSSHHSFDRVAFTTYHHVTMPTPHLGRLLFLGDAAHATSPHLGQGVNLALLDAEALATSISASPDIPTALSHYCRVRQDQLRFYSQLTYLLSPFFQSNSRLRAIARDVALPHLPRIPWLRRQMLLTLAGQKAGWLRFAHVP